MSNAGIRDPLLFQLLSYFNVALDIEWISNPHNRRNFIKYRFRYMKKICANRIWEMRKKCTVRRKRFFALGKAVFRHWSLDSRREPSFIIHFQSIFRWGSYTSFASTPPICFWFIFFFSQSEVLNNVLSVKIICVVDWVVTFYFILFFLLNSFSMQWN